ncbi:hypothetical protein KY285_023497 [Solanum tuberosum]|nr:hypothetical protein KY289_023830 [Solanum tuberosum]KAH0675696.1 hypothetical protein KY285_023497 [Solanum tuberosum]
MFAIYNLQVAEFDDVCYVQPPIGGVGVTFAMYNPRLVEFGAVRRWSPIGGVVDEVRLQAPVDGVISRES